MTLPEQTPVLEASILQADLKRAGIHPWAWVVNSSVAAAQPTTEFLQMRAASEAGPIADVQRRVERLALVPIQVHEPIGRIMARVSGSLAARGPDHSHVPWS